MVQAIGSALPFARGGVMCTVLRVKIFSQLHSHPSNSIDTWSIALAGTRVMDRMTGRAAVTSHPWKRFHGPVGAQQAGMSGGGGQTTGRLCGGGRRSTVRPGPLEYLVADRTGARPKAATATGRGRRPKAFRRLTPGGQAGSTRPPITKFRLVVTTLPSSRLSSTARSETRRGNDETRGWSALPLPVHGERMPAGR